MKGEQVSKGVQERKNVSTEVPSPCRGSPRAANVKRAFHSQSTYFPLFFFFVERVLNEDENVSESSVVYSMKKKQNTSPFRKVFFQSSRRTGAPRKARMRLGEQ